jgi:hypothetical protein
LEESGILNVSWQNVRASKLEGMVTLSLFSKNTISAIVINEYNLAELVERMRANNATWSDWKLFCVLYWQNTARSNWGRKLKLFAAESCRILLLNDVRRQWA